MLLGSDVEVLIWQLYTYIPVQGCALLVPGCPKELSFSFRELKNIAILLSRVAGCALFTLFSSWMYDYTYWLKLSFFFYCSTWFNNKCVKWVSEKWNKCKYVLFFRLNVILYNPFLCFWFKSLIHLPVFEWTIVYESFPLCKLVMFSCHLIYYCLHWVLWLVRSLLYFSWLNSVMMKWLLPNDSKEESL